MKRNIISLFTTVFFLFSNIFYAESALAESNSNRIQLSKSEVVLKAGEVVQINASYRSPGREAVSITKRAAWSSEKAEVAKVVAGKITALKNGSTTIRVTYRSYSATVKVTVKQEKKLTMIELSDTSLEMLPDESLPVTATAFYSDNSKENITNSAEWSIDNKDIAEVQKGIIKAHNEGVTNITASYKGVKAKLELAVLPGNNVLGLDVSEQSISMSKGDTASVKATACYGADTQKDVTGLAEWAVEDPDIAEVNNGIIHALSPGKTLITVSFEDTEAYVNVEVTGLTAENRVKAITLSQTSLTLEKGKSAEIQATALYEGGVSGNITQLAEWYTERTNLVQLSKGKIVALAPGTAIIMVSFGGVTSSMQVVIPEKNNEIRPTALNLSNTGLSLNVGDCVSVSATVTYSNGSVEDVTGKVSWCSENSSIVSVNNGTVTGNSAGMTTVKAAFGGLTAPLRVTVLNPTGEKTLMAIRFSSSSVTVAVGQTSSLTVIAYYSDGTTLDVTGKSSLSIESSSLASISPDGVIKGISGGNAVAKATYEGKLTYANVKVTVN